MLRAIVKVSAAALLSSMAFSGLASATGDAAAGSEKIAACAACHGTDGRAAADIYPSLNGQSATYLDMALKAYRAGERAGGMAIIMTPQAAASVIRTLLISRLITASNEPVSCTDRNCPAHLNQYHTF